MFITGGVKVKVMETDEKRGSETPSSGAVGAIVYWIYDQGVFCAALSCIVGRALTGRGGSE